jgi:3-hydroxyacyl-CoA dehydrogenase
MSVRPSPTEIEVAGVVGTGAVGSAWIALFLARGMQVVAYDPGPASEARTLSFTEAAWPALRALGLTMDETPPLNRLRFAESARAVAEAANYIQENVPERPALKQAVLKEIDAAAAAWKVIGSSTGGIAPSILQPACAHSGRFLVVHPFNPAHLIPLVEVVPGQNTDRDVVAWAMAFCHHLGKHPIEIRREATGHMTNRLQFALLREAVHCLSEGLATAEDIDAAVRLGLGPRWALMGSLLNLHLAGGPGGMKGILDHTGDAIEGWWAALGTPKMDSSTRELLVRAAAELAQGRQVQDWEGWRDQKLVQLLKLARAAPTYGNDT